MTDKGLQYIGEVLSGKQVTCEYVKLAVKRHLADLDKEDYPYYYDPDAAIRVVNFIELLKHSKGKWAGSYLVLEPFQHFIVCVLFGWKKKSNHKRRFRKAYIEKARKNGKTTLAAAIGNYCFTADNEAGAECYSAATKRDQAKISHSEATRQVKSSKALRKRVTIFANNMSIAEEASKYVPLGADSKVEDGLNPSFALIDEYHAHPDDSMVNVLQSGMGAREQPLLYIITTSGFEKASACYRERETAVGVLENTIADDTYFSIIYTLDEKDEWTDENVWIKANPNLDVSVSKEFIRNQVREALDSPTKQNNVKTKNLNIWTQAITRWILAEKWDACSFSVDEESLRGRVCYGGLDLSTTIDITAIAYCFPPQDESDKYKFIYRFFIPADNIIKREQKDKVPYSLWRDEGLIIATSGDVIDYDFVEAKIKEDGEKFDLREMAFDPHNAQEIINHITNAGITEMVPFRQGYITISDPSKAFERRVLKQEIAHSGNPVMKWMVACTEVKQDAHGNIIPVKPDRRASGKRIDGVIASIMALDRAWRNEQSVYEDSPMLIV
jgi:phage terminase large subunit-like protein